jgi:hypothetical protein
MKPNLYNVVNSSNIRMLNRRYQSCQRVSSDSSSIIACMLGTRLTKKCDLNKYITYYGTKNSNVAEGVSTWQGMCEYTNNMIVICGTTNPSPINGLGLLYIGNIECNDPNQTNYIFRVPNSLYTSCYGPRYNFSNDTFTLVGSYNNRSDINTYGFLFRGSLSELENEANYITEMQITTGQYPLTFVHSTDGNFAVGASGDFNPPVLSAWIYNIDTQTYTPYAFQNATYTTIYGIILNLDNTYTIVGGWSNSYEPNVPFSNAFISDMIYDETTGTLSFMNETSITLANPTSHFEGISRTKNSNIYTIAGYVLGSGGLSVGYAFVVRRENGLFKIIKSTEIKCEGIALSNSVLNNTIVGYFFSKNIKISYQCVIDWKQVKFQK